MKSLASAKTTDTKKKTTTTKNTKTAKNTKETQKTTSSGRVIIEESYTGRKITAVVLLILGIIAAIGYFKTDALFVGALCNFIKSLIGWGMFIMPVVLILASILLFIRLKKPLAILRTVCILLIPIVFGGLVHLFAADDFSLYKGLVGELWHSGKELTSGGLISGGITTLLVYLISRAGAFIVHFVLLAVFVFVAANIKFRTVAGKVKTGAESEMEKRKEQRKAKKEAAALAPEPEPIQIAPEPVQEKPQVKSKPRFAYDIPVDDPIIPEKETTPIEKPVEKKEENKVDYAYILASERQKRRMDKKRAEEQKKAEEIAPWDKEAEQIPSINDVKEIIFSDAPDNIQTNLFEEEKPVEPKPVETKPIEPKPVKTETPIKKEPPEKTVAPAEDEFEVPEAVTHENEGYSFPPLELLPAADGASGVGEGSSEARLNTERLESAFRSFGISLAITGYTRGPTVTRYEAELEAGTKLSKLTNLEDDIALALGATGVRIAAMPNKIATVGIEVPNKVVGKVLLREIIDSNEFKSSNSRLTFAIGKNISGDAIVGNISKLPHLLVAGTTGSGKSVCLNSLILSILYKARPDEVKFIMVDPKMVEFKIYSGIPHLLVPVVTEPKKAAGALQWAVVEMLKRYRYFADENARDLESYNAIMRSREDGVPMYQLVVVIDELADLMMMAAKEVEESICRIAQMGRAAGIHLVIATQSPRADVITGLMKANIPSRIALKVSSSLESRIILDAGGGAEKLLGNGDMLYMPIGSSKPLRVQGTWVSDEERESVIEYIKSQSETQYSEDAINGIEKAVSEKDKAKGAKPEETESAASDFDELLPQAVEVTLELGQASTSMLQRKLKLGYSRAARIVDQMEDLGVIGPFEGSKPRQLLITRQQWQEMQFVNGTAPIETIPDDVPLDDDIIE